MSWNDVLNVIQFDPACLYVDLCLFGGFHGVFGRLLVVKNLL